MIAQRAQRRRSSACAGRSRSRFSPRARRFSPRTPSPVTNSIPSTNPAPCRTSGAAAHRRRTRSCRPSSLAASKAAPSGRNCRCSASYRLQFRRAHARLRRPASSRRDRTRARDSCASGRAPCRSAAAAIRCRASFARRMGITPAFLVAANLHDLRNFLGRARPHHGRWRNSVDTHSAASSAGSAMNVSDADNFRQPRGRDLRRAVLMLRDASARRAAARMRISPHPLPEGKNLAGIQQARRD